MSTPGHDLAATLDALGDLDEDIARAVAGAVVDRLRAVLAAPLLPRVAEEIVRALRPEPPPAAVEPEPDAEAEPDPDADVVLHPRPSGQR